MNAMHANSLSESIRGRIAAVALCVALSVLIIYWASASPGGGRRRTRRREPSRPDWTALPEAQRCQVLRNPYSPFPASLTLRPGATLRVVLPASYARSPRPAPAATDRGARPARLVRFRPFVSPNSQN